MKFYITNVSPKVNVKRSNKVYCFLKQQLNIVSLQSENRYRGNLFPLISKINFHFKTVNKS